MTHTKSPPPKQARVEGLSAAISNDSTTGEWEDVPGAGEDRPRSSSEPRRAGTNGSGYQRTAAIGSPRKRRGTRAQRTPTSRSPRMPTFPSVTTSREHTPPPEIPRPSFSIPIKEESPKPFQSAPPRPPVPSPWSEIPWDQVPNYLFAGTKSTILYTFSIVRPAIRMLRYPLVLILFLFLLANLLNFVSATLQRAFKPLCYVPGISMTSMCQWVSHPNRSGGAAEGQKKIAWADYSALVDVQSRTFEQLLDESLGGTSLALDIKKTEMATSDLATLIRLSDLHSKESLADTMVEFVNDAKATGRGLSRLSSKVNGAIDSIMAMNDYALHAIEAGRAKERSRGVFNSLAIWSPRSRKSTDEVIRETFGDAMHVLASQMARLLVEVEASYSNLNRLEEKLSTLHEIVSRENSTVSESREELLADLWTTLGWNRKELRNFDQHLTLLKDLTTYRKQALAHVVAALHTLQGMELDMDDMRERVALPDLAGKRMAPEVHMKSIRNGLERLKRGRIRARKIEEEAMSWMLGFGRGDSDGPDAGTKA